MTNVQSPNILRRHLWTILFREFACFNEKLNVSQISSSSAFSLILLLSDLQGDEWNSRNFRPVK